jgi:hypothetical protein
MTARIYAIAHSLIAKTRLARLLRNTKAGIRFNEHIAEDCPVIFGSKKVNPYRLARWASDKLSPRCYLSATRSAKFANHAPKFRKYLPNVLSCHV